MHYCSFCKPEINLDGRNANDLPLADQAKDSDTDEDTIPMSSPRPSPTKSLPALDSSPLTFKTSFDSKHTNISLKKSISERYKKESAEGELAADNLHSDEKYLCVDSKNSRDERPIDSNAQKEGFKPGVKIEPTESPSGLADDKDDMSEMSKKAVPEISQNAPIHTKQDCKRRKHSPKKPSSRRLIKEANDSPDSSTDPSKSSAKGDLSLSSQLFDPVFPSFHQMPTTTMPTDEPILCQVCGDLAAGFYCSAYICEACKKFFIRASKLEHPNYVCQRQKNCEITKESRVHCQHCRYQKCLQLNMSYPKNGQKSGSKAGVQEIPCRVCSAPSSGFHFGALTCEGCKGFFRRMVKEREAFGYKCSKNSSCEINTVTRNMCKTCRFNKCLQVGMSVEGSRIGRQPNAIKHAISLEAKKQVALKIEKADVTHQDVSDLSPFNFDTVLLDPCQTSEVETNLKIPHEDGRNVFNSLSTPQDKHLYPHLNEGMDADAKGVATMDLPHVSPTFNKIRQDPPPSSASSSAIHFPHIQHTPSHIEKKTKYSRSLSSQGIPHRPLSFSSQSSYPCDKSNNTSLDLSTSAPDANYSRSHQLSLPNSKASILFPPSDISLHHFHHLSQSKYYPPYSDENHLYKSKYLQMIPDMNLYGCRENIQRHEYSQPLPQDSSLRDVKPCLCQNPKCRVLLHVDPQSGSCRYSRVQEGPDEYHRKHERKDASADYSLSRMPVHQISPHDVCKRDAEILNLAAHRQHPDQPPPVLEHLVQPEVAFSSGHESKAEQSNVNSQSSSTFQVHTSHIKPSTKKQSPVFQSPEVFDFSSKKHHPHKTDSHEHKQALPSHPIPPSPKETDTEDKSLNLVVSKTAHHPKLLCKETFSRENVQSMMDLAAKEISHLCMVERAKSDEIDPEAYSSLEGTWERMMAHFYFHAKCIVRFAKKIPGFRDLHLDDQVSLLRNSTYVIVVLNHARSYEPDTNFFNYFNFTKKEKDKVHEFFPQLNPLPSHFLYACKMAHKHNLAEMEYAFLSCLLLLDIECMGIINNVALKDLRDIYMESFHDYELEKYNSVHYGELLFCLPEFTKFAQEHNTAVGTIIGAHPQLNIPQLYAEMYSS